MGVSMKDIESGLLGFGNVVTKSMQTWNTLTGSGSGVPAPAQTTVSLPAVANQQQVATSTPSAGFSLGSIPPWAWLAGGVGLYLVWRQH
jgi:hypothetical protein